jgi:class 3 adenylate cyclase
LRALFSRYVAPPIVDELMLRKDPRLWSGRSLHATIVVCRIWNFAGFAETLSPEETLRYLNEFFALAGTSIQKHRGMIDKFLADGIIGVFGVPLEDPAAEEHALRAALDIVRLVHAMDRRWRAQGRRSFQVGIGINSGEVIAGDAGFHERREFTVVGPQTLLAARLQETTQELHASVVASATTCNPVRALFSLVPLTGHPLPGIKRLADAFIVLGLTQESAQLSMPAAGVFKETQVQTGSRGAPPAPATVPLVKGPAAAGNPARVTPPPPEIKPLPRLELADPLASLRSRRRAPENLADSEFGFPESQPFGQDDAAPIFPEPPRPPIGLPP